MLQYFGAAASCMPYFNAQDYCSEQVQLQTLPPLHPALGFSTDRKLSVVATMLQLVLSVQSYNAPGPTIQ